MSSIRKCENEVKHLDRRKTDLHRFLDPFTLLLDRSKTILAVSEDDLNLSPYANTNVIEARTMFDRNDRKKTAERNRDEPRKTRIRKIEENDRDINKEREKTEKHTNEEERYALYDISIYHSTRKSAIAIIIFVFNKSTVLRRVYSTTRISSLHTKKKNRKKRWNKSTNGRGGIVVIILRCNNVIRRSIDVNAAENDRCVK